VGANVKSKATIQWLLGLLDSTDDTQIRNQAAYALADLRVEAAVPILVRLLSSEVAANHRGPLLFALLPLNYHNYLGAIAPYLDSEEYELVEYALQLLEQLPPRLKARQTRDAIKRLEQLAVSSANTEYVNQGIFLLKAATYPKL
jgi:HEAT repeat protein